VTADVRVILPDKSRQISRGSFRFFLCVGDVEELQDGTLVLRPIASGVFNCEFREYGAGKCAIRDHAVVPPQRDHAIEPLPVVTLPICGLRRVADEPLFGVAPAPITNLSQSRCHVILIEIDKAWVIGADDFFDLHEIGVDSRHRNAIWKERPCEVAEEAAIENDDDTGLLKRLRELPPLVERRRDDRSIVARRECIQYPLQGGGIMEDVEWMPRFLLVPPLVRDPDRVQMAGEEMRERRFPRPRQSLDQDQHRTLGIAHAASLLHPHRRRLMLPEYTA